MNRRVNVVVHGDVKPIIPLFCENCSEAFSSSIDVEAYERVKVCRQCELAFVERDRMSWNAGVRPTPVAINEELLRRERLETARYYARISRELESEGRDKRDERKRGVRSDPGP